MSMEGYTISFPDFYFPGWKAVNFKMYIIVLHDACAFLDQQFWSWIQ